MLYGLDLFSGVGGNTLGLRKWVKTIAYCEKDPYAQSILLSRMGDGSVDVAPIWDDVTTLSGDMFNVPIDIIIGGFPCQDISVAGKGAGLAGERSGLFFEIVRLAEEIKPKFLFLENVAAIRTRGLDTVVGELSRIGYDCRWGMLSAFDVGAPHRRERWFCLAHANGTGLSTPWAEQQTAGLAGVCTQVADAKSRKDIGRELREFHGEKGSWGCLHASVDFSCENVADSDGTGSQGRCECGQGTSKWTSWSCGGTFPGAWQSDAGILRVAHGIPKRVDRLRCLGNAVVPLQAREAFKRLMGL